MGKTPPGRRRDVTIFRDTEGYVIADVVRACAHYSPPAASGVLEPGETGYDCGPEGDEPKKRELALNILNEFVPPGSDGLDPVRCNFVNVASATAFSLHVGFAEDVVGRMDPDGEDVPAPEILRWLKLKGFDPGRR